jgi:hypothetical protein
VWGPISGLSLGTVKITSNFRGLSLWHNFCYISCGLKYTLTPTFDGLLEYISAHLLLMGYAESLNAGRLRGKVAQYSARFLVKSVAQ